MATVCDTYGGVIGNLSIFEIEYRELVIIVCCNYSFVYLLFCTGTVPSAEHSLAGIACGCQRDYKPNSTQLKGKRIPSKERPVRSTRSKKEYESVVITDAEEEISSSGTEGEVGEGYLSRYPGRSKAYTWDSTNASVGSVKSEDCWSPIQLQRRLTIF